VCGRDCQTAPISELKMHPTNGGVLHDVLTAHLYSHALQMYFRCGCCAVMGISPKYNYTQSPKSKAQLKRPM
jgi:hypothetical protein